MALHLEPGATLKQYRIVGLLGRGGMGEVYAADDTRLGRKVAIKILPAALAGDSQRLLRFTQEAKAASALNHPSILTIYDVDDVDGQPFLVTELIEGQTLRKRLRSGGLTLREAIEITGEVASALSAAHAAGIVHRDVKPENIMLREDGHAKLLDFGLAKIAQDVASSTDETVAAAGARTSPGVVMGTTAYMSPEQARGLALDARSDIFSLGVVLYEMVAGKPPFQGETPSDVIAAILRVDPPQIADLPLELEHTLRKTLEKDREERHQTAKDLSADLKRLRRRIDPSSGTSPGQAGQGAASWTSTPKSGGAAASATAAGTAVSATGAASAVAATKPFRSRLIIAALAAVVLVAILAVAGRASLVPWFGGGGRTGGREGIPNFEALTIEKIAGLGDVRSPVISPDGKLLAYVRTEGAENSIWLRQMATGSVVKVVGPTVNNIANIQFTPDSNFLYYNDNTLTRPIRYVLMAVPAFGGTAREVAVGRFWRPSFSPDGKRFVIMRDAGAHWELVVMNADGSGTPSVIATRSKSDYGYNAASWSPSGSQLAVLVVERVGNGFTTDIQFMKPDGTGVRTLTPAGAPPPFLADITWSASDEALLAIGGSTTTSTNQVLLIRASDGQVQRVTNDVRDHNQISFSRGSGAIATVQTTNLGSIQVGPAERPEDARELPGRLSDRNGGAGLSWLNDRELVFTRESPVPSLWMMNADGTGERRLAEGVVVMLPRASRNGQTVLFEGLRQPGDFPEIFRLTLPDGRVTQVTRENGALGGTLSADGRSLFFRRVDEKPPNQILGIALDGGAATSVYEAPGILDFALSPDGTRFAVITNSGVGTPRTVNLVAATGGPARTIFTTGGTLDYVRWYPSGDALLLRIGENRQWNIFRLDLAGGAPHQLTHVTRGFVIYPEISPDGRRIAYFRGTSEPDIVLLKPKAE